MTYYLCQGNVTRIIPGENAEIKRELEPFTYSAKCDERGNFYLEKVENFELPKKIYGNATVRAERLVHSFLSRPQSTGAILLGEKGSGKTMTAKLTATTLLSQHKVPTILVNSPLRGEDFNTFVQQIKTPCTMIFDELEKVYDRQDQEQLLTLFDGVYNTRKLFLVTVNDRYGLSDFLYNRPGRMRYMFKYDALGDEFVLPFLEDTLIPERKHRKADLIELTRMCPKMNFDMLQSIVEEVNRYDDTVEMLMSQLNISNIGSDDSQLFKISIFLDKKLIYTDRGYYHVDLSDFAYRVPKTRLVAKKKEDDRDLFPYIDEENDEHHYEFTSMELVDYDKEATVFTFNQKAGKKDLTLVMKMVERKSADFTKLMKKVA